MHALTCVARSWRARIREKMQAAGLATAGTGRPSARRDLIGSSTIRLQVSVEASGPPEPGKSSADPARPIGRYF